MPAECDERLQAIDLLERGVGVARGGEQIAACGFAIAFQKLPLRRWHGPVRCMRPADHCPQRFDTADVQVRVSVVHRNSPHAGVATWVSYARKKKCAPPVTLAQRRRRRRRAGDDTRRIKGIRENRSCKTTWLQCSQRSFP
jgi:hypothetical protein